MYLAVIAKDSSKMKIAKMVVATVICFFSLLAFSEELYPPLCYVDTARTKEVILLGTTHFLRYQPRENGRLERMIQKSNLVLFETTAFFPADGVFEKDIVLPEEARTPVRLDSLMEPEDIQEVSKILGVKLSAATLLPQSLVAAFVDAVMNKTLVSIYGKEMSAAHLADRIYGGFNTESAAFVYALSRKTQVHALETNSEALGVPEFKTIRNEIRGLIACSKESACIREYERNSEVLRKHLYPSSIFSYDEVHDALMRLPGFARVSAIARNKRMSDKMITFLSSGTRALIIVGTAHVGGRTGLAAKLESEKFDKVKCGF